MASPVSVDVRAPQKSDLARLGQVELPGPSSASWLRSRVAVAPDGSCVGAAWLTFWPATDSYFCEVSVDPRYQRRGIGTRLYASVYETVADPAFLVLARAMRSHPQRRFFADSIGCSPHAHCPEPWLDPTRQDVRRWAGEQEPVEGYPTAPMRDHPARQVGRAWADYFMWAHAAFGPVRREPLDSAWEDLRRRLDDESSMVSLDEVSGEIVAISLVSPEVWDGRTMIISETTRPDQPAGEQLLRVTLAASLDVLDQRGTQLVELEGHATDHHFPTILADLPTIGSDPMDVLRLHRPRP